MSIQDEIVAMLKRAPVPLEEAVSPGASEEAIADLVARLQIAVPDELREWLLMSNGSMAGRGGIFGIRPDNDFLDIEAHLELSPSWKSRGWLPIASDGCGSYYVMDAHSSGGSTSPVYFVDHENGLETASYVVASGLWSFLRLMLKSEELPLEDRVGYWPFDKESVLKDDPALASYVGQIPFPWDTA